MNPNAPAPSDELTRRVTSLMGAARSLVDWNWAARGNGSFDAASWASSLTAELGPPPAQVSPGQPEMAALLCGYFASKAGLTPPSPGSQVREIQLTQLRVALPWAAGELGLPPPAPLEGAGVRT